MEISSKSNSNKKLSLKNMDLHDQSDSDIKKSPGHNTFVFYMKNQFGYSQEIVFDSNFDSGNLMSVEKQNNFSYTLNTSNDGQDGQINTQKSWFLFSVKGFQANQCIKFQIQKVNSLWALVKSPELYKPVYRIKYGNWKRLENPVNITKEENIDISFEYTFQNNSDIVYFSFSYPYTYTECSTFSQQLFQKYQNCQDFYFHKELLVKSYQQRNLDLITISSREGIQEEQEEVFDQLLFPEYLTLKNRAKKFRQNKPVILLSARVHPSESPSSFSMKGILKFLTDKKDARAMLLRKFFVFKIIPMLNPDGVFNGHYRMDTFGQNLNRFYSNPDYYKQPSCYAVKKLSSYLHGQKRLVFYCDLHAHQGKKGCFFYGNAIDDYVMQVESQVFAKLMSLNCINFEYQDCNFSKKQMTTKDRREAQTKEGSGRVTMYKTANLIHSYTLECGFHLSNYIQELAHPNQIHRKQSGPNNKIYGFTEDEIDNSHSEMYKNGPPFYTIEIFENIGKNLMISILDVYEKNPYSRIQNSHYKTMDGVRKEVAQQVAKLDRFKKEDSKLSMKCKKISEFIQDQFYNQFYKNKSFQVEMTGNQRSKSQKKSTKIIKYQIGQKRNSTGFIKNTNLPKPPGNITGSNSVKNYTTEDRRESKTSENNGYRRQSKRNLQTQQQQIDIEQMYRIQQQQIQQQIQNSQQQSQQMSGKQSPQNQQIYKVNIGYNNTKTSNGQLDNINQSNSANVSKSPSSNFNYLSNFNSALQLYSQKENQNSLYSQSQQQQNNEQQKQQHQNKYKFNITSNAKQLPSNSNTANSQFFYKNNNGTTNMFFVQQKQVIQGNDLNLNVGILPNNLNANGSKGRQSLNKNLIQKSQQNKLQQQLVSQRGSIRKKDVLIVNNLNGINKQFLKQQNTNTTMQQKFILQQSQKLQNNPVLQQLNQDNGNIDCQYVQSKVMKFPDIKQAQQQQQQLQQQQLQQIQQQQQQQQQQQPQQLQIQQLSQQQQQEQINKTILKIKVPPQQQKLFNKSLQ